MIVANIDVTKVDKAHLYEGKKGKYLSLVFFDKPNENSDGYVVQGVSKENRDKGVKGAIVGSWKNTGKSASGGNRTRPASSSPPATTAADGSDSDQVPF